MVREKNLFSIRRWCGVALIACMASGTVFAAEDKVLNIYNWSDYIGEDTVRNFEKETGIKVRYDTYDSNETLHAKLVTGRTGYDIVVPSSNWAKIQIEAALFKKIDKSKIPNYRNIDPWILKQTATMDPGNQYLAPYMWGTTTVGINVDKVKAALGGTPMPENAWDLVFKPEYAAKLKSCGISVLDSGDEIFPAALHYLGKPAQSKVASDYQDASKLLKSVRPYITLFSSSGYINEMANGSLCVSVGFNGDLAIAKRRALEAKNGQHIQVLLPKGGSELFFDSMAIPADAQHVEAAYKWIDYIYRPDVQAQIVNKVFYANPVKAAHSLIDPSVTADKALFPEGEALAALYPPDGTNNDIRRLRTRLYTSFKTGL